MPEHDETYMGSPSDFGARDCHGCGALELDGVIKHLDGCGRRCLRPDCQWHLVHVPRLQAALAAGWDPLDAYGPHSPYVDQP